MSRQELAEQVNAHLFKTTGNVFTLDANYIGKLERGEHRWPNEAYRLAFRAVLRAATDGELGFHVTRRPRQAAAGRGEAGAILRPDERSTPAPAALSNPAAVTAGAWSPNDANDEPSSRQSEQDLTGIAAEESLQYAAAIGSHAVPDALIDQLRAQVRLLAREYATTPPSQSLSAAVQVRNLGLLLLGKTHRPCQMTDVYLGIGHACAVMGIASFDLRAFSAASQQATAAYVYGEIIGHSRLRAWALGIQSQIAFWQGQPAKAVRLAAEGLTLAPDGEATARMLSIEARAYSHLGDAERTRQAVHEAQRARAYVDDGTPVDLRSEIGGPFGWGPARQAACLANALLRIGDAEAAASQARAAIELQNVDDTGTLVSARAYADIAAAELLRHELDAAQDALNPVWEVPTTLRRYGLLARLGNIVRALDEKRYRGSPIATALCDTVRTFADEAPPALSIGHDRSAVGGTPRS